MSIIWWTEKEREKLKQLYPQAPKAEIASALPNKTWYAIQKEASRLGIKRTVKRAGRPRKEFSSSHSLKHVIKKSTLKRLFCQQNLTVDEIAIKLKVHPDVVRRCIYRYGL